MKCGLCMDLNPPGPHFEHVGRPEHCPNKVLSLNSEHYSVKNLAFYCAYGFEMNGLSSLPIVPIPVFELSSNEWEATVQNVPPRFGPDSSQITEERRPSVE